ncbi:STG [Mytilus edulis]|uniref:M-phase inducer phosphatase n=1 Tax=Mytilus edulis TaxID=6550 RepID=A0A8S3ST91_MYTED|nr:STG [Mytilus edulis]
MSRKSLFGRKKSLDFTSACLQDSVIQKGNNTESSVVLCDEDSGLGMEETMQSTESPFLCSSFGGLLTIFDEDSHDTSLSELQGKLTKLKSGDSKLAKRSLFHQKRLLDTDTPKLPSKRPCRPRPQRILKKSLSFGDSPKNNANISTDVVNKLFEVDHLVADGSRPYCLPTIHGKNKDLKSITPETVADLVSGKFDDKIGSYRVIDCRYPFEYDGGHIKGAENLYTQEAVTALLEQRNVATHSSEEKSNVLIFHCEFSSERGPKLCRFLRNKDREINAENYPHLTYPEVYLLEGGYKAFYPDHMILCKPMSYKSMFLKDHAEDVRHFRSKSKSWTAGERKKNLNRILF